MSGGRIGFGGRPGSPDTWVRHGEAPATPKADHWRQRKFTSKFWYSSLNVCSGVFISQLLQQIF